MRFGLFLAALALLCLAAACRRAGQQPQPPVRMDEALPVLRFQAPADGLLSQRDLDLFVRVRRAAKRRSDADSARAVGADPEKFAWVRARVVEALIALDARRVARASAETYARSLASLRQSRKSVTDHQTAQAMDREIAALERQRASLLREEPLPSAVASNAQLVSARRAEIEAASR